MKETIDYIIRFLLGEQREEVYRAVGYTVDEPRYMQYRVVIRPSGFFREGVYGTAASLPALPLREMQGVPLLYGVPRVERQGDTLVLHADVVAGAYFLLSRYEEAVRRTVRDVHGRFPGRESLPHRGGFLHRPVVEEYGHLLRRLLREAGVDVSEPRSGLRRIYLTHDVDALAHYRSLRGVAGAVLRHPAEGWRACRTFLGRVESDPWYTFPWLLQQDARAGEGVESVFFIKPGGGGSREDRPLSQVGSRDFRRLFALLRKAGSTVGLHASYAAGLNPELMTRERAALEHAWCGAVSCNRHHFLCSREPEDMRALTEAGITDDFTMGYADRAGFRLGTCRPVRWIDPVARRLTPLTLHPLMAMDRTLSDAQYMGLSQPEALATVQGLVRAAASHGGEMCLLWHNTSVAEAYHRGLYEDIVTFINTR